VESEKHVHFSARQLYARSFILSPTIKGATFEPRPDKPDHAHLVRRTSSLLLLCQDCGRANQCVSEPKQEHKVKAVIFSDTSGRTQFYNIGTSFRKKKKLSWCRFSMSCPPFFLAIFTSNLTETVPDISPRRPAVSHNGGLLVEVC
jgi:hypothetical protein